MNDISLAKIKRGFSELSIDTQKTARALDNIERWLSDDSLAELHPTIRALVDLGAFDLLAFNFFQTIPFGTGGRRGPVGVGTNCMNPWTLSTSVAGHVDFLRQKFGPDAALSVVIAFDVRVYRDMKQRYPEGVPNPLLGIRSRDFARIAAEVYAQRGVRVYMPDPEGEWFMSTPELSHTIRLLGASGGLNVSASHNHPDDNGGKFYEELGGQEVPPNDERFAELVEKVASFERMPFEEARAQGLVTLLDHDRIHGAYMDETLSLSLRPAARSARVVLTNLHGTGDTNTGDVLERAGFDVRYVEEQRAHDGQFPNVPFRIANPEVPESMGMAATLAAKVDADVVFATDPDADRIGMMLKDQGGQWRFINGNEIGALVIAHRLAALREDGKLPENGFVVKTEVTSMLPAAIARYYGAQVVDGLLVGCKYIADVLRQIEQTGSYGDVHATREDYLVGMEESHGVLISPNLRDKDAAAPALMLAERASMEKERGRTLLSVLDDAHKRVGVHRTSQVSIVIEGTAGMESIARIQQGFRGLEPGAMIAGLPIVKRDDYLDEAAHGPFLSGTDRTARNFLTFRLEGGARACARPSGTEPKIKLYVEVVDAPLGDDATFEALQASRERVRLETERISDEMAVQAYRFLGIEMPAYALRLSPLLGLQHKQDFVEAFLPALRAEADGAEGQDLVAWIEERLAPYGKDPRGLVSPAVAAYVSTQRASDAPEATAAVLDRIEAAFA